MTAEPAAAALPAAFLRMVGSTFGDQAGAVLAGLAQTRPRAFRANPWKLPVDQLAAELTSAGVDARPNAGIPWAWTCDAANEYRLKGSSLYHQGRTYSQSLASQLPPWVMELTAGMTVLDATAAPGGKTSQLSALVGPTGRVVALERARVRYERLVHNLKKLGCVNVDARCQDARSPDRTVAAMRFDAVLADPPCSGTGTIIVEDPASWEHLVTDYDGYVASRAAIQSAILARVAALVRPGGTLLYTTCSIDPRENEHIVGGFLAAHSEFALVDLAGWHARIAGGSAGISLEGELELASPRIDTRRCLRLTPGVTEGFFIAKMVRS